MLLNDLAKNPVFGSVEAVERAIRDGTFARKLGHISAPEECDGVEAFEIAPEAAKSTTGAPPAPESAKSLPAHLEID